MDSPKALTLNVGIALRLWDHGGSGAPVLFLHGYLDNGRSFDAVAHHLPEGLRAFCLDWRGHGESAWVGAGGSYHLLDHLKDLKLVLDWMAGRDLSPHAIVAHSMGGNIASMMAGILPDEVQKLLLLDALLPPAEEPADQPNRLANVLKQEGHKEDFRRFSSVENAVERLMETNFRLSKQGAMRMARHALAPDESDPKQFRFRLDPRLRGPTPVRYPESMWLQLCHRINAEVKIIRSAYGYVPLDGPTPKRLQAIGNATCTTVENAGHHLHVEDPVMVAQGIQDFLL